MKKKIISTLLSITIILSAIIIVPMTREVTSAAATAPLHSMYQGNNIFTAEELSNLINAKN